MQNGNGENRERVHGEICDKQDDENIRDDENEMVSRSRLK